jgi:hypothetical protein
MKIEFVHQVQNSQGTRHPFPLPLLGRADQVVE